MHDVSRREAFTNAAILIVIAVAVAIVVSFFDA